MPTSDQAIIESVPLIKLALASKLRAEIISGALPLGGRIVESTWAKKFGVARGSIREAINLLAQEGFVSKASGRSARVVSFSETDVLHLYELRGAIEGLAARLVAQNRADTSNLARAMDSMRQAVVAQNCESLLDSDLEFHLELCRLSENGFLLDHARRIRLPFFAFVRIRVLTSGQSTSAWDKNLEAHQRIVDLLCKGEADIAKRYIRRAMTRFAETAYNNWEKRPPSRRRKLA